MIPHVRIQEFSPLLALCEETHSSLVDFTHNIYLLFDQTRSSWFETPWRPCDVTVIAPMADDLAPHYGLNAIKYMYLTDSTI